MGIVYRAQDPAIGRIIAIKSIRLNEMTDPDERARLRDRLFREAQSAGMLSHPNIVTIYDILEEDGLAYIFMEFVNGQPLDDILRSNQLPSGDQLVTLLSQTAHALDYAHRKGIIHRDVKPANVMVHEESVAKVCDFGIAKITSQSMTQTGVVMGTPSYMSPELIKGEPLTGASDQFALAIMAYEILTGQKPFKADYLPTLFFKVCSDEPPAVHDVNATLNPLVDRAVRKALAKKPEDRYPTCVEFMKALEKSLAGTPDWLPMAKGPMPVTEESTTGSGGRFAPVFAPPAEQQAATAPPPPPAPAFSEHGLTQGSTGSIAAQPPPATPAPLPPPQAKQFATPQPPPAQLMKEPAGGAAPSMRIPIRDMEAQSQEPSSGSSSKAIFAAIGALVLAAAGYYGYSTLTAPSAPQTENPPVAAPSDPKPSASPGKGGKQQQAKEVIMPPPPPPPTKGGGGDPVKPPVAPSGSTASGKEVEVTVVSTPPGATVTIDGVANCKTPCTLPLKPGRHSAQLTLPGFITMFRSIEVPQSRELAVTLPEATGVLVVTTEPKGASIKIDGQMRSEVTPARFTLREGTHKLELLIGDYRDSREVTITQGGIHRIDSSRQ